MQVNLTKGELEILYVLFDADLENNLQMSFVDPNHMSCSIEGLFLMDKDYVDEFRLHLFRLRQHITEAYEEVQENDD